MKRITAALALSLSMSLSGCAFDSGVDTLLSPPKLSAQQEQIYTALKNYTGSDINLKYPKSGKNLSAFIMDDLDRDGSEEAIVFYEKNNGKSEGSSLRMNVLDSNGDKWRSVCDKAADGSEIEKVETAVLGACEKKCIIVGYSLVNVNEKTFCIYDYSDGKLTSSFEDEPYSVFDTADLNGDGKTELFTASAQTSSKVASAVIYCPDKNGAYRNSTVALSESYTGFRSVLYSGDNGKMSIFLDAETGSGNIVTEVLSVDGENNLSEQFTPDFSKSETARPSSYISKDIDGDGKIEIPIPHLCKGFDEKSQNPVYFTSWYGLSEGRLRFKYESYYSITSGCTFIIPESWFGKITARRDISKNSVTFCQGDDPETGKEIFTLLSVSDEKKSEISEKDGYMLLRSRGGKQFFIKINKDSGVTETAASIIAKFKFED